MALYPLLSFLSAFLLFEVQPLATRHILPWFGGSPAVWSAALLFFQVALLAGYAYAHLVASRLRPRPQRLLHRCLLLVSVATLFAASLSWKSPLLANDSWKPTGNPVWEILFILAASVGLPFLALSTTAPLLQAWYSRSYPGRNPYPLYAVSDAGSLLALLAYPTFIQPHLGLRAEAWAWASGYLCFTVGMAWLAGKQRLVEAPPVSERLNRENPFSSNPVSRIRRMFWWALPGCASVLLLATTNRLCQDIAVIPFLWVLPLSIYLISFVITFSGDRAYSRRVAVPLLGLSTLVLVNALLKGATLHLLEGIAFHCLFLLVACVVCHGELYRVRPACEHLTSFYLAVAGGGALGGVFVNLAAPLVFTNYWEFDLAVISTWVLLLVVLASERGSIFSDRWYSPLALLGLGGWTGTLVAFFWFYEGQVTRVAVFQSRGFHGVVRVLEKTPAEPKRHHYVFAHGATRHGFQYASPERRALPTGYHSPKSGCGLLFEAMKARRATLDVGVIGLGIGTVAAYGRPEDRFRFYEIHPEVIRLARGEGGWFRFLSDSPARIEIAEGDARLLLERELSENGSQGYDLIVADAFSGGAVPVHLITREAFAVYISHLTEEGVLAVDITNRRLDFAPLIRALGEELGFDWGLVETPADEEGTWHSTWMILARGQELFETPPLAGAAARPSSALRPLETWTDDFNNLFDLLR
ncbi:MAG: fused MFS/spermidine synthase [Candidatus Omnitrophica bacterium]|nr:hypothetical protein [bacterium]NUN97702.1 fused MFS/spermidine synthase [Candidatus Omnitrophota bacterium]